MGAVLNPVVTNHHAGRALLDVRPEDALRAAPRRAEAVELVHDVGRLVVDVVLVVVGEAAVVVDVVLLDEHVPRKLDLTAAGADEDALVVRRHLAAADGEVARALDEDPGGDPRVGGLDARAVGERVRGRCVPDLEPFEDDVAGRPVVRLAVLVADDDQPAGLMAVEGKVEQGSRRGVLSVDDGLLPLGAGNSADADGAFSVPMPAIIIFSW